MVRVSTTLGLITTPHDCVQDLAKLRKLRMSKSPSMPMFWDAYLADTTHLTTEEHGAYLLLLAAMWRRNGYVPDDDRDNARILGLTQAKWRKVKVRLSEFLTFGDDQMGSVYINAVVIWEKMDHRRPSVPKNIRDMAFERDGEKCVYCSSTDGPFHLDHIIPWSRGGDHSLANLCVSCAPCNRSKGDKLISEWKGSENE